MKIIVAETAGFCWGVRRAIDKVLELSEQTTGPIQTLGPLIHNPQALEMLEKKRVRAVDSIDEITSDTVVIRTHGITPELRKKLQAKALRVCDGTCPRVAHIQAIIKRCVRAGKRVIIAGDPGHAEVVGLMGFAGEAGHVVSSVDDVSRLPEMDRIALLSQTTFGKDDYEAIAEAVRARFPQAEVYETICDSAAERQNEVKELAGRADAVIVIGGRNSANTKRLAELARAQGTPTYHIETDAELRPAMLDGAGTVCVTAGASTPHWMIQRVTDRLESIAKERRRRRMLLLFRFFMASHLFVSLGASLLCLLTAAVIGIEVHPAYLLIAGCYMFAMHLLNHFADPEAVGHNEPLRLRMFRRYRFPLILAGSAAAVAAVVLAFVLSVSAGVVAAFATVMGLLYSVRLVSSRLRLPFRQRRLKDIPSSKDLFIGIAWGTITVVIPALHAGIGLLTWEVVSPFLGVFALAYGRSVLFDIREVKGDRLVGKETLPILLGIRGARTLLIGMISLAALWFLAAGIVPFGTARNLLFLPPLLYILSLTIFFHNRLTGGGLMSEVVTDAAFYIAGALGGMALAGWI
jgi:(E)-4-hydroxy-3-methyl-but-2-enyl pyrophosphate reductase